MAAVVTVRVGGDLKAAAIMACCKTHLHDWKCPKKFAFVVTIAKNTMGKMFKEDAKSLFVERHVFSVHLKKEAK